MAVPEKARWPRTGSSGSPSTCFILAMLALDLGVLNRRKHELGFREPWVGRPSGSGSLHVRRLILWYGQRHGRRWHAVQRAAFAAVHYRLHHRAVAQRRHSSSSCSSSATSACRASYSTRCCSGACRCARHACIFIVTGVALLDRFTGSPMSLAASWSIRYSPVASARGAGASG